ncbi:MAG: NBR1-Ig-like domain-containing protein, partial [Anaerolineales bacterium]
MFPRTRGFLLLLSLCLAACAEAAPSPTATAPPLPPEVTEVLPPTATATVPPPTPTATLASQTPTPTPETRCANDSEFLNDLTVPDGAQFLPGQTFVKKWSVRNTGTCDWGPDYRLVL